jgi:hypothetical protein
MMDVDFPEELCVFIQRTIPTIEAAELLVLLSRNPLRQWTLKEIVHEIRPTVITEAEAQKCLLLFRARNLVIEHQDASFQFSPASATLDSKVRVLAKAYNERPVTLIRMIYSRKIQSFADAFRIEKDKTDGHF